MFLKKKFTSYLLKLIFALAISNVLTVSNALASQCEVIYPNQATQITTHLTSVCVTFKSLNLDKTHLVLDRSYSNNASYLAVVKDALGKTLVRQQVSISGTTSMSKLDPGIYDESTIHLYPITDEKKYTFSIVYNEDTETNETLIYIGLNAILSNVIAEPCSNWNCTVFASTATSTGDDAAECTDENRPPSGLPENRETGEEFNLDKSLLDAREWLIEATKFGFSENLQNLLVISRLIETSKVGGPFDFSHAPDTMFIGDEAFGNFYFAAHARVMGVAPSVILRSSAAYQAISDNNGDWLSATPQAFLNYVTQSGDGAIDVGNLLRGIQYIDEVLLKNQDGSGNSSCIDSETINGGNGSGPIGSGGGSGNSGGNSGTIDISSGVTSGGRVQVCFVQKGYPTYCWFE